MAGQRHARGGGGPRVTGRLLRWAHRLTRKHTAHAHDATPGPTVTLPKPLSELASKGSCVITDCP